MGTWVQDIVLEPGETLVWRIACTWTQGGIGRGGHLALTSWGLVFQPNRVDAATGAGLWRLPLPAVRSVGVAPRSFADLFAGGLRRRMRLDLTNGDTAVLLVNRLDQRVREVRAAVDAARSGG
jgi:hypothetical protein